MSKIIQTGHIYASEPRAVRVREPENLEIHHSAVHGTIDIVTDSVQDAHKIIGAWREITESLDSKVAEVLSRETVGVEEAPNKEESQP